MGEDLAVSVTVEKSTALGNGESRMNSFSDLFSSHLISSHEQNCLHKECSWKSADRDAALAQVENGKKVTFIIAWEDGDKAKAENKAQKKKAAITASENSKRPALEAELKKVELNYENKKAEYAEKIKNKIAMIHKAAEKRAEVDAMCGKELLKAEESSAKYRATGQPPKKALSWFGA